jgi:imidazole glycerol phosphate synthase subunit HisF
MVPAIDGVSGNGGAVDLADAYMRELPPTGSVSAEVSAEGDVAEPDAADDAADDAAVDAALSAGLEQFGAMFIQQVFSMANQETEKIRKNTERMMQEMSEE